MLSGQRGPPRCRLKSKAKCTTASQAQHQLDLCVARARAVSLGQGSRWTGDTPKRCCVQGTWTRTWWGRSVGAAGPGGGAPTRPCAWPSGDRSPMSPCGHREAAPDVRGSARGTSGLWLPEPTWPRCPRWTGPRSTEGGGGRGPRRGVRPRRGRAATRGHAPRAGLGAGALGSAHAHRTAPRDQGLREGPRPVCGAATPAPRHWDPGELSVSVTKERRERRRQERTGTGSRGGAAGRARVPGPAGCGVRAAGHRGGEGLHRCPLCGVGRAGGRGPTFQTSRACSATFPSSLRVGQ